MSNENTKINENTPKGLDTLICSITFIVEGRHDNKKSKWGYSGDHKTLEAAESDKAECIEYARKHTHPTVWTKFRIVKLTETKEIL